MNKINLFLLAFVLLLSSCNIEEEGISEEKIIEVTSIYGNQVITNFDIPFVAKDGAGNDITANVSFLLDGQAQSGTSINFSQTGTYNVTAQLELDGQTITSQAYTINAISPRHSTKVLVEDYTGTWCTNCPRVIHALEEAVQQNNHVVPVSIHIGRWPGDDPFGFADGNQLTSHFNISQFPSPILNRLMGNVWDETYSSLQTELNKSQGLGLAISSTTSGNNLDVTVKTRFDMSYSQKDLSLVVYLTEDGLHADQANATQYYGGQDPIPNFEHKHVLRQAFTGVFGTNIPANQSDVNQEYTYTFSGSVSTDFDLSHCSIVAFVIDNDDVSHLINIQKAAVGSTQNYD